MNSPVLTPLDLLKQMYSDCKLPEAAEPMAETRKKVEAQKKIIRT